MKRALTYMQIAQREEILRRLALGETLTQICKDADMPSHSAVIMWALNETTPDERGVCFANDYAQARLIGYTAMADELVDASRAPRKGQKRKWVEHVDADSGTVTRSPVEIEEQDDPAARRLHVDTLKWLMSKALPKMYGDKLNLTPPSDPGDDGYTVTFHKLPPKPDAPQS